MTFPPLPWDPRYEDWLDNEFNRTHPGYAELRKAELLSRDAIDPNERWMMRTIINQIVRETRHNIVSEGYCSYYWSNWKTKATQEEWNQAAALSKRYRSFKHYMNEVRPEWKEVEKIHWMDNSIDSVQVCKCGKHTRRKQLVAPHGDICF